MIVEDIPLLVESQMAPMFPLVVIVHADVEVRVQRLIEYRGFSEEGRAGAHRRAGHRGAAPRGRRCLARQLRQRRRTHREARALWHERIQPFAHNLHTGRPAQSEPRLVPSDPQWPAQARRIVARLRTACGHRAVSDRPRRFHGDSGHGRQGRHRHQVTVASLEVADELAEALLAAGYPRTPVTEDVAATDDPSEWGNGCIARPIRTATNVHVRVDGSPGQQFALLFVDWLTATPQARSDYLALNRRDARGQGAVVPGCLSQGLGVGGHHGVAAGRLGRRCGDGGCPSGGGGAAGSRGMAWRSHRGRRRCRAP